MGTITGKSGGLGTKVRGTVQAKSVTGTKNAPKKGKKPSAVTFGPGHVTPSGEATAASTSSFSATAGAAVKTPARKVKNFKGSNGGKMGRA